MIQHIQYFWKVQLILAARCVAICTYLCIYTLLRRVLYVEIKTSHQNCNFLRLNIILHSSWRARTFGTASWQVFTHFVAFLTL